MQALALTTLVFLGRELLWSRRRVIDELGRVVGLTIRNSIHPTYDAQILAAAKDWKYKPATLDGQPVKYRRLISINVQR